MPAGKKSQKLNLVKVTTKQATLLGSLILYFNGQRNSAVRRRKALANPENYIHNMSLTGIYEAFKISPSHRPLVKFAASIFFKQMYRGNNKTRKTSGWAVRNDLKVNGQLIKLLPILFEQNKMHMTEVQTILNYKIETDQVEVTTTFKFEDPAQAEIFKNLVMAAAKYLDEVEEGITEFKNSEVAA